MPIVCDYVDPDTGVPLVDAYVLLRSSVHRDGAATSARVIAEFWVSAAAHAAGRQPIVGAVVTCSAEQADLLRAADDPVAVAEQVFLGWPGVSNARVV